MGSSTSDEIYGNWSSLNAKTGTAGMYKPQGFLPQN